MKRGTKLKGLPDPNLFRVCRICKEHKLMVEFKLSNHGHCRRHVCRECMNKQGRLRAATPAGMRLTRESRLRRKPLVRADMLRKRYGLTLEQYDALLERQGGGCALCGRQAASGSHLHVDHNHTTDAVRGILCVICNRALGVVEYVGLNKVTQYLGVR